jgi:hypothetical protein
VNGRKYETLKVADSMGRAREKTGQVEGREDNINKKFWKEIITCIPFATC